MSRSATLSRHVCYGYDWLCQRMQDGQSVGIIDKSTGNTIIGRIVQLQKEDGSGRCWNVTLSCGLEHKTVFVRTV